MTAQPDPPATALPILFEAVSAPPCALTRHGFRVFALLLVSASLLPAIAFALMGAWPVLGFVGVEIALVLGMLAAYRRRSARAVEWVVLTGDRLVVRHADGAGRRAEASLDPYWARVSLEERAGQAQGLFVTARGHRIELGRFLSEAERRDLAEALSGALRRYRTPAFDNPQLR
jgi:uncharacterized membrane protein